MASRSVPVNVNIKDLDVVKAAVAAAAALGRTAGYAEAVQALRNQADSWFDDTKERRFWLYAAAHLEHLAGAIAASAPSATTEEPSRGD